MKYVARASRFGRARCALRLFSTKHLARAEHVAARARSALPAEYRYDVLGRRVLVRTTRDGVCVGGGTDVDCTSGIERFVYAGDNVLWEMRGPGSSNSTPAELDQAVGTGQEYGAIGYTHPGGVDRPLAVYKLGVNAAVIAPHTNWRGQFSGGTYLQGSQSTAPVSWPGYSTTAWYQGKPPQEQNRVYMGTVLEGQRDASGQMYMRNRMYDPQTGQFTQTDPIGIAGGLNTYGFANGDPVTYSDPYGLFGCENLSLVKALLCEAIRAGSTFVGAAGGFIAGGGGGALVTVASGGAGAPAIPTGAYIGATAGAGLGAVTGDRITDALFSESNSGSSGGGNSSPTYKVRKPGQSGSEAASDVPSWARGERPLVGENGTQFARRLLNDKYGSGNYATGPATEFNKIKKYGDRAFVDPPTP